ncbi:hypothetical protein SD960_11730 [Flavobacterium sp. MMLR14_040]|uniref:hypothetical protein n=1 Tax=Flavobacterium sp. MMLR14_040 TaxID=3093843 RepID=UPI00298F77BB|nr:hypothetical protein [Flavobacterium sp. MMLR14_040]MDW8850766.1 hypothetical protein [Flavobacterium sp. MMLR14_040]
MNTSDNRNDRSDNQTNKSETMESKDTIVNQGQDQDQADTSGKRDQYNEKSNEHPIQHRMDDNDNIDPNFQKETNRPQYLDEDLKNNNDPDRRTLDEYNATTAEPEDDDVNR